MATFFVIGDRIEPRLETNIIEDPNDAVSTAQSRFHLTTRGGVRVTVNSDSPDLVAEDLAIEEAEGTTIARVMQPATGNRLIGRFLERALRAELGLAPGESLYDHVENMDPSPGWTQVPADLLPE